MNLRSLVLAAAIAPLAPTAFADQTVNVLDLTTGDEAEQSADVPADVVARIKASAQKSHPDDYSTMLYVIETQLTAYRDLQELTRPEDVPPAAFAKIKANAARSHRDDFSTTLYVIGCIRRSAVQPVDSTY